MSTAAVVCIVGNLLAVIAILPHLSQAVRERRPSGSPYGWGLGALCGALFTVYGLLISDPLVGAPGWVTVPIGTVLAVWAWRYRNADGQLVAGYAPTVVSALPPLLGPVRSGDTLVFQAIQDTRQRPAATRRVLPPVPGAHRRIIVSDGQSNTVEMPRIMAHDDEGWDHSRTVEMPVIRVLVPA